MPVAAGTIKRVEELVLRVQQPIDHRPARIHTPRELGLRDLLVDHFLQELPGENALDRLFINLSKDAFLFEEPIEAAALVHDLAHFLVSISFLRFSATCMSAVGVF
jgi:hypothetical protein